MTNDDLEELDLVSAIWILSSNDENHMITYEGIRERLGLSAGFDVRDLVNKRRELFRPKGPTQAVENWKKRMREKAQPSWIRSIKTRERRSLTG